MRTSSRPSAPTWMRHAGCGSKGERTARSHPRSPGYCVFVADGRGERRTRIIGRDPELARVGPLLEDALAGRGRLIVCTGEAGIGKTRLAEEIAALAGAQGAAVVWARATDPGSSPPYGLWRLAVDSLG